MNIGEDPSRPTKKLRVALETEHMATLKASYLVHFSEWCKSKSKICQKLQGYAWILYTDLIEEQTEICNADEIQFDPDKLPAARTLQDALALIRLLNRSISPILTLTEKYVL